MVDNNCFTIFEYSYEDDMDAETINNVAHELLVKKKLLLSDIYISEEHIFIKGYLDLRGDNARILFNRIPKLLNQKAWILYQLDKLKLI